MDRDTAEAVYCREESDCGRSAGYYAGFKTMPFNGTGFFCSAKQWKCLYGGRALSGHD